MQTLRNTDEVIRNEQTIETGSIGYTSRRQTKQKHNTTRVVHHYPQTNTTSIRHELFCKQLEVKLNRTFKTEIVTNITIRNSDTQNDITNKNKKIQISNPDTTKKPRVECHLRLFVYGTHFCRYALIHCLKLALAFTTTIKILCIQTILNAEI